MHTFGWWPINSGWYLRDIFNIYVRLCETIHKSHLIGWDFGSIVCQLKTAISVEVNSQQKYGAVNKKQLKNEFKSMKENVLKKGNISSAWKQCHLSKSIKHFQQTTQFLLILSNPVFFNDDSKYGFHHPDSGVHFGKLSRNSTLSVEYFDWNKRRTLASLVDNEFNLFWI